MKLISNERYLMIHYLVKSVTISISTLLKVIDRSIDETKGINLIEALIDVLQFIGSTTRGWKNVKQPKSKFVVFFKELSGAIG